MSHFILDIIIVHFWIFGYIFFWFCMTYTLYISELARYVITALICSFVIAVTNMLTRKVILSRIAKCLNLHFKRNRVLNVSMRVAHCCDQRIIMCTTERIHQTIQCWTHHTHTFIRYDTLLKGQHKIVFISYCNRPAFSRLQFIAQHENINFDVILVDTILYSSF